MCSTSAASKRRTKETFVLRMPRASSGWWLEVTGKGNNTRLVPATDELIAELASYRRAHALPPTPQFG